MNVQENVGLAPFTTFRVGGPARYFVEAEGERDIADAFGWAADARVPVAVLGGGSNLLVPDAGFGGLVLRVAMTGMDRRGDLFDVAAGENWDGFVDKAVEAGWAGVECLAGIPGSVGASPVQNVGAYGQEVAETMESVRAFDRQTGDFVEMGAGECGFRYRRSVFNGEALGRYVITRVRLRLREGGVPYLEYTDLKRWFKGKEDVPNLAVVSAAVRTIRGRKGMVLDEGDPDTWSAGSYFKNPIVPEGEVQRVAGEAGVAVAEVPRWGAGEGCVKLSAAWLLEGAGFGKGFRSGAVGLSTKHALALTNRGGGTCAELLRLEETIRAGVRERFGVALEREPVMLGSGA